MKRLLIVAMFLYLKTSGQSITGKVQDGENKLLPLINILLLSEKDSSLVKGTTTDEKGNYNIEKIKPGRYLIKASAIGFRTAVSPVFAFTGEQEIKIPAITLLAATTALTDVTVTAKRPFIEQKIDRTIVNVANSIIASGGTALDVLEKAPGITVDRQNDQISLRGKDGVLVQIDGKQSYMPMADVVTMLKSMPSDNIDRIEIITNPSAKYDAAGTSGIIDIRLKKNNNIGTNGSITAGAGFATYERDRASAQINHREKKLNFFGSLAGSRNRQQLNFDILRDQPDGAIRNIISNLSIIDIKGRSLNSKIGVDYFLNKSTTLGIVWTQILSSNKESSPARAFFRRSADQDPYLISLTDKKQSQNPHNQLGNLNIQHSFSKKQASITLDFDIGKFNRGFQNRLNTQTIFPYNPMDPIDNVDLRMPTVIDIKTFKSDYSMVLNKWKLEAGIKIGSVGSENNLELLSGKDGNLTKDTSLSNQFRYNETVKAAYFTFTGKLNPKTDILFGIRAEQTNSKSISVSKNSTVKRNYLNIFPSVFVTRPLNKNNVITGSYSYRIDRPNYQTLNPGRSYVDAYTYSEGNPFLKPQYTHSFELKHGYKSRIFTSIGASLISDFVYFIVEPVDAKLGRRRPDNFGSVEVYNLTVSFPVHVMKGWDLQTTAIGSYNKFKLNYKGNPLNIQSFVSRLTVSNSFVLSKSWSAELAGWLTPPRQIGLDRNPWLGSVDAGIQKVFNQKWKMKFSSQDIFFTNNVLAKTNLPEYFSKARLTFDTRYTSLTITYTFGNQTLKSARQRKTGSEEELQRTN